MRHSYKTGGRFCVRFEVCEKQAIEITAPAEAPFPVYSLIYGRSATPVSSDRIAAAPAADAAIVQSASAKTAAVPIVATAVCARVFSAPHAPQRGAFPPQIRLEIALQDVMKNPS